MEAKYKITRCHDKELIKKMHAKIMPGDRFYSEESQDWIATTKRGKVVGFCMLGMWSEGVVFLARAGVLKDHRGNGLHKRLILVREKRARKMEGINSVMTYTAIESVASSLNLEKSGYKLFQPERELIDAGNWLYWMKPLIKKQAKQEVTDEGNRETV